jgi:hypothetical protein
MAEVARITGGSVAREAYGVVNLTSLEDLGRFVYSVVQQVTQWPSQWITTDIWLWSLSGVETRSSVTVLSFPEGKEEYVPRTPLGRKLLQIRKKAIQAGMKLLSADEILEEVRRRRGEIESGEEDVY